MNIYAILSGWKNYIDKTDVTEQKALSRAKICAGCEHAKQGSLLSVVKDDVKMIEGYYCDLCKCPISAKVRQDSEKCDKGKW